MVSPQDEIQVLHHSPTESDVLYSVGSTIIGIKIIADASNVGWRTSINVANLCDEVGMLKLGGTKEKLVVAAHNKNYWITMCGHHQELGTNGECYDLGPEKFSIDNFKHYCQESATE